MAFENTIEIINQDIKELNLLIERFKKYDKIPQIDIDLALSKTRELYDLLLLLDKNNATDETVKIITPEVPEVPEIDKKPIDSIQDIAEKSERSDLGKKTLADQFEGKQRSVNETIAKNNQEDISSKIQSKSIEKIQSAIGINEKFLFIKELFQGDSNKFNNAINELNNMSSFDKAYSFLNDMNLNMNDEIVVSFINIVKRKFTK